MELRQLHYFLASAKTRSFRKAAELCLVAQPALSRQIAALEAELGLPLFERSKQGVSLTPAGQEFVRYASEALDELQRGQHMLAHMQEGSEGIVQIGCVEPLATAFLPALFQGFHRTSPRIRLSVRVARTDDVLTMVEQGEMDLGFIFDPSALSDLLVMRELFQQPLHLLVAAQRADSERYKHQSLQLADVLDEPVVLLRETSRLRRRIEQIASRRGIRFHPLVEIDSLEGLKELVRQDCGVTFLPPALLGGLQASKELRLFPLADVPEQFSFALVYRAFGTTPRAAMRLITHVLEHKVYEEE